MASFYEMRKCKGRCCGMLMRVIVVGLVWMVISADGYPDEDLITSLPGQPAVSFKQFGGYVDIYVNTGKSLFYYFVEAETDPQLKPLTLWLNGDPGCSSVGGGAFTELGPFYPTGDGQGLRRNPMSWNQVSNLLFLDSPAGVGWSYSNTTSDDTTGDAQTANDTFTFLLNWFDKFPEYKTSQLFLTGESYAGYYVPQLAVLLMNYNQQSNDFKFNLKGIAMGNPLLRLGTDFGSTYDFFWSHGMTSDEIGDAIMNNCDFDDYSYTGDHNESTACNNALAEANIVVGDYINNFDVMPDVCYPSIVEQELRLKKMATKMSIGVDVCMTFERVFYFSLPEVQKALHANRTNLPHPWSTCSDPAIDMLPTLETILNTGIPVWVFSGDQDAVVPLLGSRYLVRELAEGLNLKTTVPSRAWLHGGQVGGWTMQYGNILTFATVRGAAHMVAYSQPSRALHLFSNFVQGRPLPNVKRNAARKALVNCIFIFLFYNE